MRIKDLPKEERPREKLLIHGASSLSVLELLAILLRTGRKGEDVLEFSASLLNEWGGLEGLCRAGVQELMREKGLNSAKVATLAAVLELGRRIAVLGVRNCDQWQVRLEKIAEDTRFCDREMIYAIFLDAGGKVIEEDKISYGGQSGAYLDIPVFYRKAVRINAYGVVLLHNHPDGSSSASCEDIAITEHVRKGLNFLGVELLGHYIAAGGQLTQVP
ncbi:MAG: DNA repair protein RadC [Synergistaceae bacterium]|nr:DNA repair protein RadC [Synergistaceae bacterium]